MQIRKHSPACLGVKLKSPKDSGWSGAGRLAGLGMSRANLPPQQLRPQGSSPCQKRVTPNPPFSR